MDDYYAHAQQASASLFTRRETARAAEARNTKQAAMMPAYENTTYTEALINKGDTAYYSEDDADDDELQEDDMEIADDLHPISGYFEITILRQLLLEHVSVVLAPGQLHSPDVQLNLIAPLWQSCLQQCGVRRRGAMRHRNRLDKGQDEHNCGLKSGGPLASAAMLYAALANRDYFMILASAGQSQTDLHESRAEVAEALGILCAKALHKLGDRTLSNALCAKFTPLDTDSMRAKGATSHVRGTKHVSLLSPDQRVRVYRLGKAGCVAAGVDSPLSRADDVVAKEYLSGGSRLLVERTMEVAIRSEAKRFTALKPVAEVVRLLWDGTLHWKGFQCATMASGFSSSRVSITMDRRQFGEECVLLPQTNGLGRETPVSLDDRWPASAVALEKWLVSVLEPLRIPMVENTLTMVHAFFFLTLYTIVSLRRQSALNVEEVILHICALAYIADEIRQWLPEDFDKAFDVLAVNASMLWPRLFAVLDQYEFCGTVIIQVRRIISGTSLFFALLIVMTAGFFQTFFALSQRHNELGATSIWGLMARIFFGSALVGWDQADLFGPYVGYVVMSMYIAVSMLILYNILIGVINQCMVEITQNAAQEFRFAYTMRVVEYVSAKQTYPCVPPLNILQVVVFWPLRKTTTLSQRSFAFFRSLVLLMAYLPHLVLYSVYKIIGRWWRAKSGAHSKALRAECYLAEKELARIKIRKNEIDEFAFSGSVENTSSGEEDDQQPISNQQVCLNSLGIRNYSSTTTVQPECSVIRLRANTARASRWSALMEAWKQRRRQSSPVPIAAWSPNIASATMQVPMEYDSLAQTNARLALMENRIMEVDKKLNSIAQLLRPAINST
ncbi:hypothetical protein GGI07_000658 [Coemansia sp. Benny D115]|nr:hypothetical protein GGI07_000658 [Coemansia sp. Benny D115]